MGLLTKIKSFFTNIGGDKEDVDTKPIDFTGDVFSGSNLITPTIGGIGNIGTGIVKPITTTKFTPASTDIDKDKSDDFSLMPVKFKSNLTGELPTLESTKSIFTKLNEAVNRDNLGETVGGVFKRIINTADSKAAKSRVGFELFNYDQPVGLRQEIVDTFDDWIKNDGNSIDTLKQGLKSIGVKDKYTNKITKETIIKSANVLNKDVVQLQKNLDKNQITSIKQQNANAFDAAIRIPGTNYTNITDDDGVKIFQTIQNLSGNISDVDMFKKELTKAGVDSGTISNINNTNIDKIKNEYVFFKDDNKISSINNGNLVIIDGRDKKTIDWEGNVISTETLTISEKDSNMFKQHGTTQISEDIKPYINGKLVKMYPTATADEINAIYADVIKTIFSEESTMLDDIKPIIKQIEKAKSEGRQDIVDKLQKDLDKANSILKVAQTNMLELTDIIIDNKLVGGGEINRYIKEKYGMPITEFIKRDKDGKPIDTGVLSIPDAIKNISLAADLKYSMSTDELSPELKAYIFGADVVGVASSALHEGFARLTSPFRKGLHRAQIGGFGYMDVIPGHQSLEVWRKGAGQIYDLSDEFFTLFPTAAVGILKGTLNVASLGTKISGLNKLTKGLDSVRDISLFGKGLVQATFKTQGGVNEVNKLGLLETAASNAARSFAKDMYIEGVTRRIDPERGEDWNIQLSAVTFALPYLIDVNKAIKSLGLDGGISNFDVAKTLGTTETSWNELTQLRKQYRNMSSELFRKYNSFDTQLQKEIKANLGGGMVITKKIANEMALNYGKKSNEFIDFGKYMANDPEGFIAKMGKYMKEENKPEMQTFIDGLKTIVNDPNTNIVDVIKYSYDLPGTISIMGLKSTIPDTAGATATLATAIKQAAKVGDIAPIQFVGGGVGGILDANITKVFGQKFLPSRKFSEGELLKAQGKAKGTPLEWLLRQDTNDKFVMFKRQQDGNFVISKDGLKQLGIIDSPTIDKIIQHIDDEDYAELTEYLTKILGRDISNLTVEGGVIPKLKEFLSSKICK